MLIQCVLCYHVIFARVNDSFSIIPWAKQSGSLILQLLTLIQAHRLSKIWQTNNQLATTATLCNFLPSKCLFKLFPHARKAPAKINQEAIFR